MDLIPDENPERVYQFVLKKFTKEIPGFLNKM